MFGRSGLSGMCRDIQMDRAGPRAKDVKSHRKSYAGVARGSALIRCEKPVRETDATCLASARGASQLCAVVTRAPLIRGPDVNLNF